MTFYVGRRANNEGKYKELSHHISISEVQTKASSIIRSELCSAPGTLLFHGIVFSFYFSPSAFFHLGTFIYLSFQPNPVQGHRKGGVCQLSSHHSGGTPWKNGDLYNLHETVVDYSRDNEMSLKLYQFARKKQENTVGFEAFSSRRNKKRGILKQKKSFYVLDLRKNIWRSFWKNHNKVCPGKSPVWMLEMLWWVLSHHAAFFLS